MKGLRGGVGASNVKSEKKVKKKKKKADRLPREKMLGVGINAAYVFGGKVLSGLTSVWAGGCFSFFFFFFSIYVWFSFRLTKYQFLLQVSYLGFAKVIK